MSEQPAKPDPGPATTFRESVGAEATEALAAEFAGRLVPGDVVLLHGDLGAGKTTFVRGAARGLGSGDPVSSPTFTLAQRYEGTVPISHIDLYRLGDGGGPALAEEVPGLLDEYLGPEAVCFVEWPELLAPGDLPAGRRVHEVTIEISGAPWAGRRRIGFAPPESS